MRLGLTKFAVLLWVACSFAQADEVINNNDIEAINVVIDKYFQGTEQGVPQLLAEIYLPSAELQYESEGEFKRIPIQTYIGFFEPGKKPARKGHIVAIDVTGTAATAKAVIYMRGKIYTDYFLLLKVQSVWKIANKISSNRAV